MTIAFDDDELRDPSSLPTRDGRPVLPGDERETCNTCLWCELVEMKKGGRYVFGERYKAYCVCPNSEIKAHPIDPDDLGCDDWTRDPVNTFKDRLAQRQARDFWRTHGETPEERGDDMSDRQREDDNRESERYNRGKMFK